MGSRNRIYVGRLADRASDRDIENFFRDYGRINDIIIKRGFGFVVSSFHVKCDAASNSGIR